MGFPGPLRMLKVGLLPTPRHLALQTALHLRARQNFRDLRGVTRKTGEEWLVTVQDTEAHVPDVHEEVLGVVPITTLGPRNYCVILDPVGQDGKNQLGQKRVVKVSASTAPPRGQGPANSTRTLDLSLSSNSPHVHVLEAPRLSWLLCLCILGSSSETLTLTSRWPLTLSHFHLWEHLLGLPRKLFLSYFWKLCHPTSQPFTSSPL